jgi:hypothetical protein
MIVLNGLDDVRDPGRNDFDATNTASRLRFFPIRFLARPNLTPQLPVATDVN